ncbi:hypothetical protein CapIbe_017394 [Capra ibex]
MSKGSWNQSGKIKKLDSEQAPGDAEVVPPTRALRPPLGPCCRPASCRLLRGRDGPQEAARREWSRPSARPVRAGTKGRQLLCRGRGGTRAHTAALFRLSLLEWTCLPGNQLTLVPGLACPPEEHR